VSEVYVEHVDTTCCMVRVHCGAGDVVRRAIVDIVFGDTRAIIFPIIICFGDYLRPGAETKGALDPTSEHSISCYI